METPSRLSLIQVYIMQWVLLFVLHNALMVLYSIVKSEGFEHQRDMVSNLAYPLTV